MAEAFLHHDVPGLRDTDCVAASVDGSAVGLRGSRIVAGSIVTMGGCGGTAHVCDGAAVGLRGARTAAGSVINIGGCSGTTRGCGSVSLNRAAVGLRGTTTVDGSSAPTDRYNSACGWAVDLPVGASRVGVLLVRSPRRCWSAGRGRREASWLCWQCRSNCAPK